MCLVCDFRGSLGFSILLRGGVYGKVPTHSISKALMMLPLNILGEERTFAALAL